MLYSFLASAATLLWRHLSDILANTEFKKVLLKEMLMVALKK